MVDYAKLRSEFSTKRLHEIATFFGDRNPIFDLNTAMIDNNQTKIELSKTKLEMLDFNYTLLSFDYLKEKLELDIAYLLPHNLITGGLKILIEQANTLQIRGHNVSLYSHVPKPEWIDINCEYIQVPADKHLYELVPNVDIVIAGYWDLIIDAVKTNAPMLYCMAQGDIDIFEYDSLQPGFRNIATIAHSLPVKILTVSNLMQKKIRELYNRESVLIPNAIDNNIFYPMKSRKNDPLEILLIGNDKLSFKGHDDIIRALFSLKNQDYDFRVKWATPAFPSKDYTDAKLNIQHSICPTQDELGRLYRTSDIYISGSYYESFSLPPLEAMASGTAVITTSNEGVNEYAVDNENCLMFDAGNLDELIEKVNLLLESKKLRKNLIKNGLKIAEEYNWERSIDLLEEEFLKTKSNLKVAVLENA